MVQYTEKAEVGESTKCSSEYQSADNVPLLRKVPQHVAKRLLIIDAMNVMHMRTSHANRTQKQLDCLSLLPVMRYFIRRGHAVEVVMPEFCTYKKCCKNFHIWKDLNALKLLIMVPHMMHDDLVALTVARDACGSVVTQDKFRDHLACFPQLHRVRSRNIILAFTSDVKKPMFFTNAKGDKYYKDYFMCINYSFKQFYSLPEDDDYDLVKNEKWSEERRKEVLGRLDEIYELAEAQFMLAKVEQSPKCNSCNKPIKTSIDVCEEIVSDGEQNGIAEDESMKALVCWRNTAEKQELEYQLQGRRNDAYQRYTTFSFAEDNLYISGSSNLQECTNDENSKDDASKHIPVIIKENAVYKGSLTEVTNPSSLKMWIKHETEQTLFKDDRRAESKAHLWKTLTDELKLDGKSFHDFLSSFHGTLEKEFVLNAYYDQLNSLSLPEREIMNVNILEDTSRELCSSTSASYSVMDKRSSGSIGLGIEKERIWRLLVDELNLDSSVFYNILRSWDEDPLEVERIVDAYFDHVNDWKTRLTRSKELSISSVHF